MPFNQDIRAGTMEIQLNISVIAEWTRDVFEDCVRELFDEIDVNEGSKFWMYVYELEWRYDSAFNTNPQTCPNFYDWFVDNYNNMESLNDVIRDMDKVKEEQEEEEKNECWGINNKCERDEFGCCIVCCDCKECIKRIKEEHAALEEQEEDDSDEEEDQHDVLDMIVLGFKTTERLNGDWNSLLFEIRNHEFDEEEEPNKCDKCGAESYKYSTEICETLGDGYYCNDCIKKVCEEEEQYKKVCDEEGCDKVLCIDTPIMCYMHNHNGDKTLCRTCYEDGDYQDDDENSDNYDSEDEE